MNTFDLLNFFVGFLTGIITSLIANWIQSVFNVRKDILQYSNLSGKWIERIDIQIGRRFSVADFKYDKKLNAYRYNGTNYKDDSSIHYRWQSETIFKDNDNSRILYIYSVFEDGNYHIVKDGFGVSYFDDKLDFTHGYFIDANSATNIRNIQYVRIEILAKKHSYDLDDMSPEKVAKFIKFLTDFELKNNINCIDNKPLNITLSNN